MKGSVMQAFIQRAGRSKTRVAPVTIGYIVLVVLWRLWLPTRGNAASPAFAETGDRARP